MKKMRKLFAMTFIFMLSVQTLHAASATWNLNPGSGDWNTAANWTPVTVPNGSGDTATFDPSNATSVSLSTNTEVNGIVFNAGASAFAVTASSGTTLTISGVGITNNSGITQNFVTAVSATTFGVVDFLNSATAGSLTAFTNPGSAVNTGIGGLIQFYVISTAGNGTFTNNAGTANFGAPALTAFRDDSTAGNSTFTNNGAAVGVQADGGKTGFYNNSTALNGTFTNNGGAVTGALGGNVAFYEGSTAGNGTFVNNGGSGGGAGGTIFFNDSSTVARHGWRFSATAVWTLPLTTLRA